MQLRAVIAAAFIARLLFRAWWRRSFLETCLVPSPSGQDALQGLLETRPRSPELLDLEALSRLILHAAAPGTWTCRAWASLDLDGDPARVAAPCQISGHRPEGIGCPGRGPSLRGRPHTAAGEGVAAVR